eukprot:TRINITY_DN3021_c0_g1::TRINITY_DN3021_c0_g1_i1::g.22333::m.22333 TRINITY_DN3021_c0_g1::TRINITY_DN3021_c0_g1_i1::g.22333  ORF type:complete len:239 (-),score=52.27,sp/Q9BVA0/KTNB1_HUMAN/33.33/3e-30,Katanin_con80/PF13925.1/6.8e-30,Katanin_con80/PF13925.1/3.3e+02 TRINITY_DN3021_c0_g1_i1:12-728(-)
MGGMGGTGSEVREGMSLKDSIIPEPRGTPVGLDMAQFMPRAQPVLHTPPAKSDLDILEEVGKAHHTMCGILNTRLTNLKVISKFWSQGNVKGMLEMMGQMRDAAVVMDTLGAVNLRSSFMTLDLAFTVFMQLHLLLDSKFETYIQNGLSVLRTLQDCFDDTVVGTLTAPPAVGVDFTREQRMEVGLKYARTVLGFRAAVGRLAGRQGAIGAHAREGLDAMTRFADRCGPKIESSLSAR